ncbi:MAG: hypothetical protein H6659_13550 [Ardenticatenaceae bacterium]|nr:hypothetical protein [Ardenticatenaceae bacterium]MCB8988372.1 hypothetical protein [Ardenticatenaceae bacterium]
MSTIHCYDDDGQVHLVGAESLHFSPAVYGVFIENDRLLLLAHQGSGLYTPPGCILTPNESPAQAIRHYFRRLVDITPELGPLLFIEDQYRWLDGRPWQITALYYALARPFTASIGLNESVEADAPPRWVDLFDLQRSQFLFGFKAVTAGVSRLHGANLPT